MNARPVLTIVAVLAGAIATASVAPAIAQVRPPVQHVLSRGLSDPRPPRVARPALARNDRTVYGRIDAIRGDVLSLRTRDGRLTTVDATQAIRDGTYSAPLFVGKRILVTGFVDATRTLHARIVERQTGEAGVPADH